MLNLLTGINMSVCVAQSTYKTLQKKELGISD